MTLFKKFSLFCKNPDCRLSKIKPFREQVCFGFRTKERLEKDSRKYNKLKRRQQPCWIYYADTALNVLLKLELKQSGFTIHIKRICQKNTRKENLTGESFFFFFNETPSNNLDLFYRNPDQTHPNRIAQKNTSNYNWDHPSTPSKKPFVPYTYHTV